MGVDEYNLQAMWIYHTHGIPLTMESLHRKIDICNKDQYLGYRIYVHHRHIVQMEEGHCQGESNQVVLESGKGKMQSSNTRIWQNMPSKQHKLVDSSNS